MRLHADALARFRLCPSTELPRHVGEHVLVAGMLTTAKPVHTLKDEPMEFATFDDGPGLIETVLFPTSSVTAVMCSSIRDRSSSGVRSRRSSAR